MAANFFDSGKLEKMIITALKPNADGESVPEVSDADEDKYMVQVNPESYTVNYQVRYDRREAHGNSGSKSNYSHTPPPTLEFEFIFDGTGVIPATAAPLDNVPIAGAVADLLSGDDKYDVMTELQKFAHVVYDYSGTEHRPRNIRLIWGTLLFEGVLTSLSIDYKLFKPDGTPLRALAKTTFEGTISDVLRENKENNSSPDLTHLRTVLAGDRLPLMSHSIYQESRYYIEVARINKLFNFRNLGAGVQVRFPPLDKSVK